MPQKWMIVCFGAGLLLLVLLHSLDSQQRGYEQSRDALLLLRSSDISYIEVFSGRLAHGVSTKITNVEMIDAFLAGFRNHEQYSLNHDRADQDLAIRVVPQEIHLTLSVSEEHKGSLLGSFVLFHGSGSQHYGSFLCNGLFDWHQQVSALVKVDSAGGS